MRRNHSTQYSSYPEFDFARLRKESPEKYESYVDLQPGVWTKYRVEIDVRKARLYVHDAEKPSLIVDDLKMDPRAGGVALWVGPGTEGYFSNLKITPKRLGALSSSDVAGLNKIYFDRAHGKAPWPPQMMDIGARMGYQLEPGDGPITAEALARSGWCTCVHPTRHFKISKNKPLSPLSRQEGHF